MMIDAKAFLQRHCRCVRREALDDPAEVFAPGERKIVRVARVHCAGGPGQTGEATIQTERCNVRESGRSWGALRQVWSRIKVPCFPPTLCVDFQRPIFPDRTWRGVRADAA